MRVPRDSRDKPSEHGNYNTNYGTYPWKNIASHYRNKIGIEQKREPESNKTDPAKAQGQKSCKLAHSPWKKNTTAIEPALNKACNLFTLALVFLAAY